MGKKYKTTSFWDALNPLLFFLLILIYGLFVHPFVSDNQRLPLEILIFIALTYSSVFLLYKGFSWNVIQDHITKKVAESVPVLLILFCIGILIGSWIVSGTIPMLIYYGLSVVNPSWIYFFSFIICILFSVLTGTSWGSAGTIGVVMISIAQVYDANLAITAGAIVGGSFFGDKMSPLSDTTNIAALASDVHVYDHIKSMAFTTFPALVIALGYYLFMSLNFEITESQSISNLTEIESTKTTLQSIFNFNLILFLPLLVVLWGSITNKSIVLTLLVSSWVAILLAFIFQPFSFTNIVNACKSGFDVSMSNMEMPASSKVVSILNRGGLYNLIEGIVVSILIFAFIGTLQVIDAISIVIDRIFSRIKNGSQLVVSTLVATLFTNLTTSNQYATSFIIGSAFKEKYNKLKIDRKVLSRSIEDAGTMIENLFPWTPSGIFMSQTLGVAAFSYAGYQVLSLANLAIAFLFGFLGIAIFKNSNIESIGKEV